MSRDIYTFNGARLTPRPAALWTFRSKIVNFATKNLLVQLYPPPGPVLVEWFMVEADIHNTDFLLFGEGDTQNFVTSSPISDQCITTLGPGEWCVFEPNDLGTPNEGIITAPDSEVAMLELQPDVDLIDVCQFFLQSGPSAAGQSAHCTIGTRSRR